MAELLFIVSSTSMPCGIEMFARCLFDAWQEMGGTAQIIPLSGNGISSSKLRSSEILVLNLPLVAWKKSLVPPFMALLGAKLRGKRTLAILHEWQDLALLRRMIYSLYLLLTDMVMFSSPTVAEQFERRKFRLRNPTNAGVLPIPPNLSLPTQITETALARRIAEKANGRVVIGQFGSIYPKKNSTFVLDVAVELRRRGIKPFVVFAGSFIKGSDRIEEDFWQKVEALGLAKDVMVSGYLDTANDIFATLNCFDAMVYNFDEGLTSRRASVLTCLQSGRPVIVNAPLRSDEFDHHPIFARALADAMLQLVPSKAAPADYADAVEAAIGRRLAPVDLFGPGWRDAAQALARGLEATLASKPDRKQAVSASTA